VGDLFPHIRKDFKEKSSIPRSLLRGFFITWSLTEDVLWVDSSDSGLHYFYLENNMWVKGVYIMGVECKFDVPASVKKHAGAIFREEKSGVWH
jgi:hypothetical protein